MTIKENTHRQDLLSLHFAVLLFGAAGLFGKLVPVSAGMIVFGRVAFASLLLGLIIASGRRFSFKINLRHDLFPLILLGGLLAFHWFSFFRSIQLSTVALGLLYFASFPLFTAFLEPVFFKEKFEWKFIWLGMLTAVGLFLAVPETKAGSDHMLAVFWGLLSGLSFALITLFNRKKVRGMPALRITFYQDLFAAVFLLPFLTVEFREVSWEDVLWLFLLGTIFTALAHFLYIRSLRTVLARTASIITMLEPVYGLLLAMIILAETPGWETLLGGVLILTAAGYTSLALKK